MRPARKAQAPGSGKKFSAVVYAHSLRDRSRVTRNPEAIDGQLIVRESRARRSAAQVLVLVMSRRNEVVSFNDHCIRSAARNSL